MNKYQAPTEFIGQQIKYLETCDSTNTLALKECLEESIKEGFTWIADHQTEGRGQRGNSWLSKKGDNLLFSIYLKPKLQNEPHFYFSKAIACGIIDGLQQWSKSKLPLQIKWPNDIYIGDQKLGGILIENQWAGSQWTHSIVGIGLNINQEEFGDLRANSLKKFLEVSEHIPRDFVFHAICQSIEKYFKNYQAHQFDLIDQFYHEHLFRLNEWNLYQEAESNEMFDGKIIQVNEQGLLLMEKQNGYRLYDLKELIFIFP